MKSIQAQFNEKTKKATIISGAKQENWVTVCQRFNDDVSRVCDVTDTEDYTGLYECFDADNKPFFYLVKEDKTLFRMKRKNFLDNVGVQKKQCLDIVAAFIQIIMYSNDPNRLFLNLFKD